MRGVCVCVCLVCMCVREAGCTLRMGWVEVFDIFFVVKPPSSAECSWRQDDLRLSVCSCCGTTALLSLGTMGFVVAAVIIYTAFCGMRVKTRLYGVQLF